MASTGWDEHRALIDWLNAGVDAAQRDLASMTGQPRESWARWLDRHPEALTYHFATALLRASEGARDHDPSEALALTALLADRFERIEAPDAITERMVKTSIWIEHGNALQLLGRLPAALAAFQRALELATAPPELPFLPPQARRGAAYVRHLMNEPGDHLGVIRADIPLFEAHASAGDVLRSRVYEAAIQYDHGDYKSAKQAFTMARDVARTQRDERMVARMHNNIGHCARQLGERDEAVRNLLEALVRFERLGMRAEVFRAQWGIDLLRADEGAPDSALRALRELMKPLIDEGRTMEAALVALDVVELLVLSERHEHVQRLASSLVSAFNHAGMPREKLRAFSALRAAAAERALTVEDVRSATAQLSLSV